MFSRISSAQEVAGRAGCPAATAVDLRWPRGGHPRREYSDRIVVTVAADAPWPPAAGRNLNDAELKELYADAG